MTEEQWKKVKDRLPPEKPKHEGRPGKDNRIMLNRILYWLNTGIPWRGLPEQYGLWKRVYTRFQRWSRQGVWKHILTGIFTKSAIWQRSYSSSLRPVAVFLPDMKNALTCFFVTTALQNGWNFLSRGFQPFPVRVNRNLQACKMPSINALKI